MENYPSNSHKARTSPAEGGEAKKIEKVTVGEVVRRKKPLSKRISELFFGGDAQSAMSYVFMDVLLPALKDMAAEAVSQGVDRIIFGESRTGSRRSGGYRPTGQNGYVSYNRFSPTPRDGHREDPREISRRARSSHNFDEIILATRVEAQEVIGRLFDLVSQYESATVADLYELCGVSGQYTDEKWGWTDIRGAGVVRVAGGYLLDLPRPELLK